MPAEVHRTAVAPVAISKLEILATVKELMGLDPVASDLNELISVYIDAVEQRILNYINHSIIPDGLKFTWAAMTAGALQSEQSAVLFPAADSEELEAFEISLGDTSVKPIKPVAAAPARPTVVVLDKVVFDYRSDLNAFRKLRW